jgi:pimeloyl-ACP methyl ester carboxylesterase
MSHYIRLVSVVSGSFLIALLRAEGAPQWKDVSTHRIRFVSVETGVQLEVLEWGGPGRPIVLLAGGGSTAHVFDDFAPRLATSWHVYGITLRGFGASGYAATNDPADRLGDDVVAVIDALKIEKPILVGHSIGGAEMSSVASRHPGRIAGLVYLDSAYSYAFDNGKGSDAREAQALRVRQPPPPGPADVASFSAFGKYDKRLTGVRVPEAELRQQWESDADGRVIKPRDAPGGPMLGALFMAPKKYTTIPVPALVIFANPHSEGVLGNPNLTALTALVTKQEQAIKDAVPTAHVVELPNANHFVFLSNEADVLREMRRFVAGLP